MRIDSVVADASPLIILARGDLLHLLPQLFPEILIPAAVWAEIAAGGEADAAARELAAAEWAERVEVGELPADVGAWNLGAGESEVLALAHRHAGRRAMVDDAAARACARTLGIPVLGTGGALVLAKRRGLLPSVTAALEVLRETGLWLSPGIELLLRQQAGE